MRGASQQDLDAVVGELEFDPRSVKQRHEAERDKRLLPRATANMRRRSTASSTTMAAIPGSRLSSAHRSPIIPMSWWRAAASADCWWAPACGRRASGMSGSSTKRALRRHLVLEPLPRSDVRYRGPHLHAAVRGAQSRAEAPLCLLAEMLEVSRKIGERYGLHEKACFQTVITEALAGGRRRSSASEDARVRLRAAEGAPPSLQRSRREAGRGVAGRD